MSSRNSFQSKSVLTRIIFIKKLICRYVFSEQHYYIAVDEGKENLILIFKFVSMSSDWFFSKSHIFVDCGFNKADAAGFFSTAFLPFIDVFKNITHHPPDLYSSCG